MDCAVWNSTMEKGVKDKLTKQALNDTTNVMGGEISGRNTL